MIDIAKLRTLLEAATPRPWAQDDVVVRGPTSNENVCDCSFETPLKGATHDAACADAALIAAAANALPALLDSHEQLMQIRETVALSKAVDAEPGGIRAAAWRDKLLVQIAAYPHESEDPLANLDRTQLWEAAHVFADEVLKLRSAGASACERTAELLAQVDRVTPVIEAACAVADDPAVHALLKNRRDIGAVSFTAIEELCALVRDARKPVTP